MQVLQTLILAITLLQLFASWQSTSVQMKKLSNNHTANEIMHAFAVDGLMPKEMTGAV